MQKNLSTRWPDLFVEIILKKNVERYFESNLNNDAVS